MTLPVLLGIALIVVSIILGCLLGWFKATSWGLVWADIGIFLGLAMIGVMVGGYLCSVG